MWFKWMPAVYGGEGMSRLCVVGQTNDAHGYFFTLLKVISDLIPSKRQNGRVLMKRQLYDNDE
jgi:hypothetical protein